MAFEDSVEKAGEDMNSGSDYYKFQAGDNRIHILTEPQIEVSRFGYGVCYEGAPFCTEESLNEAYKQLTQKAAAEGADMSKVNRPQLAKKWLCWAINRATGKLVIITLTYGLSKRLTEIKRSEETRFDTWPMPYGINIQAVDNGKTFNGKKVLDYNILTSRKDTAITEAELVMLQKVTSIDEIIQKKKDKARLANGSAPAPAAASSGIDYPTEDIDPNDIPF